MPAEIESPTLQPSNCKSHKKTVDKLDFHREFVYSLTLQLRIGGFSFILVQDGQYLIDLFPWTWSGDHIGIADVKAADDLLSWFHA